MSDVLPMPHFSRASCLNPADTFCLCLQDILILCLSPGMTPALSSLRDRCPPDEYGDDRVSLAALMPHFAYDYFLGIGKVGGLITNAG